MEIVECEDENGKCKNLKGGLPGAALESFPTLHSVDLAEIVLEIAWLKYHMKHIPHDFSSFKSIVTTKIIIYYLKKTKKNIDSNSFTRYKTLKYSFNNTVDWWIIQWKVKLRIKLKHSPMSDEIYCLFCG